MNQSIWHCGGVDYANEHISQCDVASVLFNQTTVRVYSQQADASTSVGLDRIALV